MPTVATATKVHYIAISQYAWGRGDTIESAKKQMVKAGGNLKAYFIQRVEQPEDAANPYVDGHGVTVYTPIAGESGHALPMVEAKKPGKSVDLTGGCNVNSDSYINYVYHWPRMPSFAAEARDRFRAVDDAPMTHTERQMATSNVHRDMAKLEAEWRAPHIAAEKTLLAKLRSDLEAECGITGMSESVRDFCWDEAVAYADDDCRSDTGELNRIRDLVHRYMIVGKIIYDAGCAGEQR